MAGTSWDEEDENLGKVPDSQVAKRMGVSNSAVYLRRKKLGIRPAGYTKKHTPDRSTSKRQCELQSVYLTARNRQLITDMRLARGWSQRELARRSGCNLSTICYVEKGHRSPSPQTLSSICKALGLSWDFKIAVRISKPIERG